MSDTPTTPTPEAVPFVPPSSTIEEKRKRYTRKAGAAPLTPSTAAGRKLDAVVPGISAAIALAEQEAREQERTRLFARIEEALRLPVIRSMVASGAAGAAQGRA